MAFLLRISLLMIFLMQIYGEPCKKYGCPLDPPAYEPFVPAPPGHTPKCAKPGQTYCEILDSYPNQLIKFLLEECTFNFNSILKDESSRNFNVQSRKLNDTNEGYKYQKAEVEFTEEPVTNYGLTHTTIVQQASLPVRIRHQASYRNPDFFYPSASLVAPTLYQNNLWINRFITSPRTRRQNPLLQYTKQERAKRQSNSDYVSICPTKSEYISPKAALNSNGNWKYVVNLEQEQGYSQTVRSEICTRETCDGICTLPEGYTSRCQQQYVQKRLVALEGSGNRLYNEVFWFPHGCMCQVTLN